MRSFRHCAHRPAGALLFAFFLCGCHTPIVDENRVRAVALPAPLRFLLTFDDGPSSAPGFNPTVSILEQLADNSFQPQLKAVFFVQTRAPEAGGDTIGRRLMERIHREGHVLGLHTGTPQGHIRHTRLTPAELDQSLRDGSEDIRAVSGRLARFLRPPNWDYNPETLACYRKHDILMVLDDVKARDGKTWGFKWNPRRYQHIRAERGQMLLRLADHRTPVVAGAIPVIITLHDTNSATAASLNDYLRALIEGAAALGAEVATPAFFNDRAQIEQVLERRYRPPPDAFGARETC